MTSLAWEPAHASLPSRRFCSGSKDTTLRVSLPKIDHVLGSFCQQLHTCLLYNDSLLPFIVSADFWANCCNMSHVTSAEKVVDAAQT